MASQYHRDVGPILQVLQSFLRGRSWNLQNRRPIDLSPRPYPPPELPPGPSDKTSLNYYLGRDARRTVTPPLLVANNITKQIGSGETESKKSDFKSVPKPGNTYNWDSL